jgi:DNA-directed RNA polymerase subunit RPC12/RpoP
MFAGKQMGKARGKENADKISAEKEKGWFVCCGCERKVSFSESIGTAHRNHCPYCLSSKHLDKEFSGDRAADCGGCMRAVALSFKKEGVDKYGREREGELMLIHECSVCGRISINRLAADDDEAAIISLFNGSFSLPEKLKKKISKEGIVIAGPAEKKKVFIKLFGKGVGKV